MRKIVAGLFMSLDGITQSPEKWHFPYFNDEMGGAVGSQSAVADAILLGRVTYQEFASYWPNQGSEVEFANYINTTPKYVVSGTLDAVHWQNSTLISENVAERLTTLKQQPGKHISIIGSSTLVRSLLRDGLLDELRLLVHPIVVGSGKRLFEPDGARTPLKLWSHRPSAPVSSTSPTSQRRVHSALPRPRATRPTASENAASTTAA